MNRRITMEVTFTVNVLVDSREDTQEDFAELFEVNISPDFPHHVAVISTSQVDSEVVANVPDSRALSEVKV